MSDTLKRIQKNISAVSVLAGFSAHDIGNIEIANRINYDLNKLKLFYGNEFAERLFGDISDLSISTPLSISQVMAVELHKVIVIKGIITGFDSVIMQVGLNQMKTDFDIAVRLTNASGNSKNLYDWYYNISIGKISGIVDKINSDYIIKNGSGINQLRNVLLKLETQETEQDIFSDNKKQKFNAFGGVKKRKFK